LTIEATSSGSEVVLRVTDDGVGLDPDSRDRHGFGMTAMRQRARELGGRLEAQALQAGGTRVEVVV
jgi:signal transduction histidine kinase